MKAHKQINNDGSNCQTDNLTDLPITDEQAQQAKGKGSGTSNNQAFFTSMVSECKSL